MLDSSEKTIINAKVEQRTKATVAALIAEQGRVGIKSYSGGLKKVTAKTKEKDGLVNRISFKFKKYGVFVEKGAGRGRAGFKGSRWANKAGQQIRTNPKSLGKMNTGNRRAKEWFNPVIENFVEQLTNEVANEFVQLSFKKLKIK